MSTVVVLNSFRAMNIFESLVKPTDLFSEKKILMHKIRRYRIYVYYNLYYKL